MVFGVIGTLKLNIINVLFKLPAIITTYDVII